MIALSDCKHTRFSTFGFEMWLIVRYPMVALAIVLMTGTAVSQTAQEYYALAQKKAQMQSYRAALKDLDRALELDPKFIQALNYRGYVKDELDDYYGALKDYSLAIALKGDYSDAYANRAKAKRKLRDLKGALDDYSTAITLNPRERETFLGRGLTLQELAEYDAALKDFDRAAAIDPEYGKTYAIRGQVKFLKGDILGACNDLLKAQQLGYSPPTASFKERCD